ncbi:uncharacterized protein ACJ7VT_004154 [Polymixia lowei]
MTLQPTSFPVALTTTSIYGDRNNTNGSECLNTDTWDWLYTMQPAYILAISVLGILGNVFVLLVFCLHKKSCTVAEIYLGNLAAADLVLVSCLPFWAVNVANGFEWPFGPLLCRLVNLGIKMNTYCSIYFLVLVSIDRYVALVHTMSHGRMRRPKYAKMGCLLVWCFGLLLSVPTLIFRAVKYFPDYDVNACFLNYPNMTTELVFDGMLIIFSFMIPVFIISYCTFNIIQALKNQTMGRFNAENTERKATLLVLAVLLAFLICWVPFHLVTTLDVLVRADVMQGCYLIAVLDVCNQIFTYLAFFNSVLNPILYVIVGKNFRKKVSELFKQLGMKKMLVAGSTHSQLSSTLKTLAPNLSRCLPGRMTSNLSTEQLMESVSRAEDVCNHTEAWDWVYTMQPAYMSTICLLGVIGNTFVLFVFCLQKRRSSVADIYLSNLAAADLLMVACLPFWVATVIHEFHWRFGETMCRLVSVVIGMNYYCSVLFLTLVSVDRYLALTRPLSQGRERPAAWARGICLGIWVVGVLLSLPALLFRSVQFFPHLGVEACYMAYPHDGWRVRYNLTVNVLGFLVPVPVVSFCSYHIVKVLRESRAMRHSRRRGTAAAMERKAAFLVLAVLAVFVLCWLPYQILIFLDTLDYYQVIYGCTWAHVLDIGIQLATYLGYSNSSLNPFLYVIAGKHFQQRARAVLRPAVCRRKWRKSSQTNANLNSTTKYTDCSKV